MGGWLGGAGSVCVEVCVGVGGCADRRLVDISGGLFSVSIYLSR